MAESAQGVGKYTLVSAYKPDLEICFFGQNKINPIREKWRLEGAPRTPKDAEKSIEDMVAWEALGEWKP
jgi:hypothetical protein